MEGKVLLSFIAVVAYATAASISGTAGIDGSQVSKKKKVLFIFPMSLANIIMTYE